MDHAMMRSRSNSKLARFYRFFFETYGAERLNGLDESYFLVSTPMRSKRRGFFSCSAKLYPRKV